MNGLDNAFKPESFYTVEFGTISQKYITSMYKSKFRAEPFKLGSGTETRRGLRFSKEVLDRLLIHYDVPDEIVILDQTDKPKSATDATDATDYRNGDGQNETLDEGNRSSDSVQSSINVEPSPDIEAVAARIHSTTEPTNHENVVCTSNNSINGNDKSDTETIEKGACLSSKCVASVASVAGNDAALAGLPDIPCAWCDYKNTIEFDLGNHFLENHRGELMKLPVGKGSMDDRIDYAIQQTKRKIAAQYEDENAESNDDE